MGEAADGADLEQAARSLGMAGGHCRDEAYIWRTLRVTYMRLERVRVLVLTRPVR